MNEIIENIMKKYDLTVDEEFNMILPSGKLGNKYSFDKDGCLIYVKDSCEDDHALGKLARGVFGVAKLPFKPKYEEQYYCVQFGGAPNTSDRYISVIHDIWTYHCIDFLNLKAGNVFRTEEEAESHKYEVYKNLTGKEWGE